MRLTAVLALALFMAVAAGCGGGSGTTTAGGGTVRVSMASAPALPGSVAPADASSGDGAGEAPAIEHVWITVYRVALIPGEDGGEPAPDGEMPVAENGEQHDGGGKGLVVADVDETEIDLLALPGLSGQVARFLNDIPSVPAGTYGKIRLYYKDPRVRFAGAESDNSVHGTANYHIDIHFVGGNLVIPVATGPEGGVWIHNVTVDFVLGKDGLKVTVNPSNILLRPQVFATVSEVQYGISGEAAGVDKEAGAFEVVTASGHTFRVVYGQDTDWFFKELFRDPCPWVPVSDELGVAALRDTALVNVIGRFDGDFLVAEDILITFPYPVSGPVVSGSETDGWIGDTLVLDVAGDNVTVFPKPDRWSAFYDGPLGSTINRGDSVTARGYAVNGGVEAFWITADASYAGYVSTGGSFMTVMVWSGVQDRVEPPPPDPETP